MKIKFPILIYFFFFNALLFAQKSTKTLLFIGTFTEGKADSGIYTYDFNKKSGALKKLAVAKDLINPSYLSISPNRKILYACMESKLPRSGAVAAFKIDSVTGQLNLINKQSSGGENPVYVSVDKTNRYVVVANYSEGNISLYSTKEDGSLNAALQTIPFSGYSINKNSQEKSHIHAAVFSPQNDFIFFTDLGSDKIRVYNFNPTTSNPLEAKESMDVTTVAGSGPRHFIFHPTLNYAYCVEELSGTISSYTYKEGKLDSIQRIFSYSKKLTIYAGSDIHISPDGLFLYASNRMEEENTISIFSIDQKSGKLKLIGHQSTFGDHPRNFAIDPSGNHLLVANLASSTIIVFKRDSKSGLLRKTKNQIYVPRPSCLKFVEYAN